MRVRGYLYIFLSSLGGPLGTEMFERQITGMIVNQGKEELLFILEVLFSQLYCINVSICKRPNPFPQILKPFRDLRNNHNCYFQFQVNKINSLLSSKFSAFEITNWKFVAKFAGLLGTF